MATGRVPTTANSPLTAKGDLFTYDTNQARLPVGSNGETLLANSASSTGLSWQPQFLAGKNKIINGDYAINQRSFTSTTTSGTYGFDRWVLGAVDGTTTYSAQTFTVGTAPVAGYEGKNFARVVTTGQTLPSAASHLVQRIESSRTFAGQTVTYSFWAKAATGTPKVAIEFTRNYGSGGSPTAQERIYFGQVTLSTSWARYSLTASIPSLSGKTLGTDNDGFLAPFFWVSAGSDYNARLGSLGIQSNTFDFWGVQVEAGSVATAFQTATGTLAGELAACQRYYFRYTPGITGYVPLISAIGSANSTTVASLLIAHPVPMRRTPTSVDWSNLHVSDWNGGQTVTNVSIPTDNAQVAATRIEATVASGLTQYRPYALLTNNNTAAHIGLNAEL